MVRAIHAAEDIWHGRIEDLLKVTEQAGNAVPGPFVIHLQTCTAPIGKPSQDLLHFDGLHVYRLMRDHEGRAQFQLRLGIIESELQADAILATVREHYPGACKKAVDEVDRAAIARKVCSARSAESAIAASNAAAPVTPVPPQNAATEQPRTAIESVEDLRWNLDELLPCLAQIRAPRPDQTARNRTATQARGEQKLTPTTPLYVAGAQVPPNSVGAARVAANIRAGSPRSEVAATTARPVQGLEPRPVMAPRVANGTRPAIGGTRRGDKSSADSEAPQSLMTKIDTLIEGAGAHQEGANAVRRQTAAPAVLAEPATTPVSVVSEATTPIPSTQTMLPSAPTIPNPPAGSPATFTALAGEDDCLAIASAFRSESAEQAPEASNAPDAHSRPLTLTRTPGAPAVAAGKPPARVNGAPVHDIDATRTTRALRPVELADDQAQKWFAIQLSLSERAWRPDDVPALDLFDIYYLYSVTVLQQGQVRHALRIGFFSQEPGALAVANYLRRHFEAAVVTRVSMAERERFSDRRVIACKDIGATGMHAVIELATPPVAPETRLADLSARSVDRTAAYPSIETCRDVRRVRSDPE